jgi:hypothetical protein
LRNGRLVEDVAQACLLSENQINGIESDNYQTFYTAFFAQQGAKRYADHLGVDPHLEGSPLYRLPALTSEPGGVHLAAEPSPPSAPRPPIEKPVLMHNEAVVSGRDASVVPDVIPRSPRHVWVMAALAAVVAVGIGWVMTSVPERNENPVVIAATANVNSVPTEPAQVNSAPEAESKSRDGDKPANPTDHPSAQEAPTASGSQPATPMAQPHPNASDTVVTTNANGNQFALMTVSDNVPDDPKYRFFFKAHGRVDMKVTDGSGKILVHKNAMQDGDSARVIGKPPFHVVVSDGDSIEIFYQLKRYRPSVNSLGQYEVWLTDSPVTSP